MMRNIKSYLVEIAVSMIAFTLFWYLNSYVNQLFEVNRSVSWLFLPAGLRIFLTLIFVYSGAIGLSLASLIIDYISFSEFDNITILGLVTISGLAPLLSRLFVIHHFEVHPNLNNLSIKKLLAIILVFSLFSSGLHQLWFIERNLGSGNWNSFIAMFFGDIFGSIVFIALVKYGVAGLRKKLQTTAASL